MVSLIPHAQQLISRTSGAICSKVYCEPKHVLIVWLQGNMMGGNQLHRLPVGVSSQVDFADSFHGLLCWLIDESYILCIVPYSLTVLSSGTLGSTHEFFDREEHLSNHLSKSSKFCSNFRQVGSHLTEVLQTYPHLGPSFSNL